MQHRLFSVALDGALNTAPVSQAAHVLDIGTGTGVWATEYAKANLAANIIGTELAVAEPSSLPNCTFVVADAEADPWPFTRKFDYIHLRMTISCFRSRRRVLASCFANLNPSGWIELQDAHLAALSDDDSSTGTALELWCREMVKGFAVLGRDMHDTEHYAQMLRDEGFIEVTEKQIKMPWSPWSSDPKLKELGRLQAANSRQGGQGMSTKMLAAAGLEPAETEDLLRRVKLDLENTDVRAYAPDATRSLDGVEQKFGLSKAYGTSQREGALGAGFGERVGSASLSTASAH